PSRLEGGPADGDTRDVDDGDLAVVEGAGLLGLAEVLGFQGHDSSSLRGLPAMKAWPYTSNFRAFSSPGAPPNVSTGGPITTSTKPESSSITFQPAHGRPPAIQPVQRSIWRKASSGTATPLAMSANWSTPPGRNTR